MKIKVLLTPFTTSSEVQQKNIITENQTVRMCFWAKNKLHLGLLIFHFTALRNQWCRGLWSRLIANYDPNAPSQLTPMSTIRGEQRYECNRQWMNEWLQQQLCIQLQRLCTRRVHFKVQTSRRFHCNFVHCCSLLLFVTRVNIAQSSVSVYAYEYYNHTVSVSIIIIRYK